MVRLPTTLVLLATKPVAVMKVCYMCIDSYGACPSSLCTYTFVHLSVQNIQKYMLDVYMYMYMCILCIYSVKYMYMDIWAYPSHR